MGTISKSAFAAAIPCSSGTRPIPTRAGSASVKKVRYLCGLLGHRVHRVTTRHGYAEHACGCGHTFLKPETPLDRITHPLACVLFGHFVRVVARRAGHVEFVCRTCGHPFCFAQSRA